MTFFLRGAEPTRPPPTLLMDSREIVQRADLLECAVYVDTSEYRGQHIDHTDYSHRHSNTLWFHLSIQLCPSIRTPQVQQITPDAIL